MSKRKFTIVLIKPSHYDDDGYVIQWRRSTIPSNSLASVYGLLAQCAEEQALGPDVDDRDRSLRRVQHDRRRRRRSPGASGRRAADSSPWSASRPTSFPARSTSAASFAPVGVTVAVGGFHVSGCIAMLPDLPPELKEAQAPRHDPVRRRRRRAPRELHPRHRRRERAKPLYNFLDDMPDMAAAAIPVLPRPVVTKVAGHYASFDAGRGCPYQCSFCTIINVQGRKSRYRTADDVEAIVRANAAQGITRFFVTDDNFARNRNWEPILDRLIELREESGLQDPPAAAGRHALPPHPGLHREGGAGRLQRRLHRAREHQSRIAHGREEAAEQDLGISRHAARVEARACDDLGRLHPRLPDRHARIRSPATSRRSSASCRSTSSSSSSSPPCPARRTTKSSISRGRGWSRT